MHGTISWISANGKFAYVGLKTLTNNDGSPVELNTEKDIFVHQDDCPYRLREGLSLSFDIIGDTRRKGPAFRATNIQVLGGTTPASVFWFAIIGGFVAMVVTLYAVAHIWPDAYSDWEDWVVAHVVDAGTNSTNPGETEGAWPALVVLVSPGLAIGFAWMFFIYVVAASIGRKLDRRTV